MTSSLFDSIGQIVFHMMESNTPAVQERRKIKLDNYWSYLYKIQIPQKLLGDMLFNRTSAALTQKDTNVQGLDFQAQCDTGTLKGPTFHMYVDLFNTFAVYFIPGFTFYKGRQQHLTHHLSDTSYRKCASERDHIRFLRQAEHS